MICSVHGLSPPPPIPTLPSFPRTGTGKLGLKAVAVAVAVVAAAAVECMASEGVDLNLWIHLSCLCVILPVCYLHSSHLFVRAFTVV